MTVDKTISILIVDDYITMLRIIRSLLFQLGFNHVDEATDGNMAFTKLLEKPYGLVIADWNMEPVSGQDLLKKMRGDEMLQHIPFLMVTAESKTDHVVAAKEAGVNNYIVKPFNAETLKEKLVAILGDF